MLLKILCLPERVKFKVKLGLVFFVGWLVFFLPEAVPLKSPVTCLCLQKITGV